MLDFTGINIMRRVSNEEWGVERLKLYLSRKQLVMVVTYRPSVTPYEPSVSRLPLTVPWCFLFPLQLLRSLLSSPWQTPTSSIFALLLISVRHVCQNFSCDKAQLSAGSNLLICLSCADALFPFNIQLQKPFWRPIRAEKSNGVSVMVKGLKL